jgi:hypothetical protein
MTSSNWALKHRKNNEWNLIDTKSGYAQLKRFSSEEEALAYLEILKNLEVDLLNPAGKVRALCRKGRPARTPQLIRRG